MRYDEIPLGPDHPVEVKIKWADALFDRFGQELLALPQMSSNLEDYRASIDASWQAMKESGVAAECTRCAVEDGGSCCGKGIEDKFDVVTLLINRLLGAELPKSRQDDTGCWFLGPEGCTLVARHVICINFLCKRLYAKVPPEEIRRVQQAMEEETTRAFLLEEAVKAWLMRRLS